MKKNLTPIHSQQEIEQVKKNLELINNQDITIKDKTTNKLYLSLVHFPLSQAIEKMILANDLKYFDNKIASLGGLEKIKEDRKVQDFAKLKENAVAEKIIKKDAQAVEVLKRYLPLLKKKNKTVAEYIIIACLHDNLSVIDYLINSEYFPDCSFVSTFKKNYSTLNNLFNSPKAINFYNLFGELKELQNFFHGRFSQISHLMRNDAVPDWLRNNQNILFTRGINYYSNYDSDFYDFLVKKIDANVLNQENQNPITYYAYLVLNEVNQHLKDKTSRNYYGSGHLFYSISTKLENIKILFVSL